VPRALSIRQAKVVGDDRADFRFQAMRARAHYASAGCRYWLFESDAEAGTFVEFVEAPDGETLRLARRLAPGGEENAPTYTEIPLT
jgi:hypothetical protein